MNTKRSSHSITSMIGRRTSSADGADFYPTPFFATQSLAERETFDGVVWEPACGKGHISDVLKGYGQPKSKVISSDLIDRGYGTAGVDFLAWEQVAAFLAGRQVDHIVTNPPYSVAEEFVRQAIRVARHKVAFLLRFTFLESVGRFPLFEEHPPRRIYVFSRRLKMTPDGSNATGGSAVMYAWFVWERSYNGKPSVDWIL